MHVLYIFMRQSSKLHKSQHKTSNELLSESPTCIGLPRHDNSSFLPCKILSRKYPDSHTEDGDTATIHQLFKYITLSAPKQH